MKKTITLTTQCRTIWSNVKSVFRDLYVNLKKLHEDGFKGRLTLTERYKKESGVSVCLITRNDRVYMRV